MRRLSRVWVCVALVWIGFSEAQVLNTSKITLHNERYNKGHVSWQADANERFQDVSLQTFRKMLGVIPESANDMALPDCPQTSSLSDEALPASFDARDQWPKCVAMVSVRDQGICGSCWSFSAVSMLSDRFCIASNGKINLVLSAQAPLACAAQCSGCDGCTFSAAWEHLQVHGDVADSCIEYTGPTATKDLSCRHNMCTTPLEEPRLFRVEPQSPCVIASSMSNGDAVENIKRAIMTEGPVQAQMSVYADLSTYKSGVYTCGSGSYVGSHAVKLVGWGTDAASGLDYWLAQNSWGTKWGLSGFFKVGQKECGVSSYVVAATPDYVAAEENDGGEQTVRVLGIVFAFVSLAVSLLLFVACVAFREVRARQARLLLWMVTGQLILAIAYLIPLLEPQYLLQMEGVVCIIHGVCIDGFQLLDLTCLMCMGFNVNAVAKFSAERSSPLSEAAVVAKLVRTTVLQRFFLMAVPMCAMAAIVALQFFYAPGGVREPVVAANELVCWLQPPLFQLLGFFCFVWIAMFVSLLGVVVGLVRLGGIPHEPWRTVLVLHILLIIAKCVLWLPTTFVKVDVLQDVEPPLPLFATSFVSPLTQCFISLALYILYFRPSPRPRSLQSLVEEHESLLPPSS